MKDVVVVVPVYKERLSHLEEISLAQLARVLGHYPIVFIAPESLEFGYADVVMGAAIERYADRYFRNTESYSELLLSVEFYERFIEYRYMLIYQLDAFVFSDRLMEFVRLGYDYIGAPLPRTCWRGIGNRVGNGGLSLRNISSTIALLAHKDELIQGASRRNIDGIIIAEDVLFGYAATRTEYRFTAPSVREALEFAVDIDVQRVYRKMPAWLPFGCHAFNYELEHWAPIINGYGYNITTEEIAANPTRNSIAYSVAGYLLKKFFKNKSAVGCQLVNKAVTDVLGARLSLWGAGVYGRGLLEIIEPDCVANIYDKSITAVNGRAVLAPTDANLLAEKYPILVTPVAITDILCTKLTALGKIRNRDFFTLTDIYAGIIKGWYELVSRNLR